MPSLAKAALKSRRLKTVKSKSHEDHDDEKKMDPGKRRNLNLSMFSIPFRRKHTDTHSEDESESHGKDKIKVIGSPKIRPLTPRGLGGFLGTKYDEWNEQRKQKKLQKASAVKIQSYLSLIHI